MTNAAAERSYIPELDTWRAIAVGLVVLTHWVWQNEWEGYKAVPLANEFGAGILGVNIFFLISGFVICRSLLAEESTFGKVSLGDFYIRRIFRIVPCLTVYLLAISLLGAWRTISHDPHQTLYAATFVCNLPNIECGWFAGHTWSLAFEEQFYVIFPAIFVTAAGIRRKAVLWTIFWAMVALAFAKHLFHWQAPVYGFSFSLLIAGVLCAHFESALRLTMSRITGAAAAVAIPILLIPHFVYPNKYVTATYYLTAHICTVFLLFKTLEARGGLRAFFKSGALRYIGRVSYGVYLWQQLFTANPALIPWPPWMGLAVLPVIVMCSYHSIEKPLISLGARIVSRRRSARESMA